VKIKKRRVFQFQTEMTSETRNQRRVESFRVFALDIVGQAIEGGISPDRAWLMIMDVHRHMFPRQT
jgi:hypothetical protein